MNKYTLLLSTLLIPSSGAFASVLFSDNFESDTAGNLVGQGSWLQTGTSTATPLQVGNGLVTVGSSGQDAYAAFSSAVNTANGGSLFIGLDLDVLTAQATGDYFLHVTTTTGGTTGFYDKLEAKSSGSGYVLGMEEAGSDPVVWGTTVLNFDSSYQIVTEEDFVSGAANDTFELYVNPTSATASANSTYLNFAWNGTSAEAATYTEVNLRQGTATAAPTETVGNLVVGTSFSDVVAVPEPSSLALAALGGLGSLVAIRRRK
jgi:hypothetical protein